MERKVGSGRKGTVDEEEYLYKSVAKLAVRFNSARGMLFKAVLDHNSLLLGQMKRGICSRISFNSPLSTEKRVGISRKRLNGSSRR